MDAGKGTGQDAVEIGPGHDTSDRRPSRPVRVAIGVMACLLAAGAVLLVLTRHSDVRAQSVEVVVGDTVAESASTTVTTIAPTPDATVAEVVSTTVSTTVPSVALPPVALPLPPPLPTPAPTTDSGEGTGDPAGLPSVPPVGSNISALAVCPCGGPGGLTFGGGARYGPLTVGTDFIALLEGDVIGWLRVEDAIGEPSRFGPTGTPVYGSDATLIGHLVLQGVDTVFEPI